MREAGAGGKSRRQERVQEAGAGGRNGRQERVQEAGAGEGGRSGCRTLPRGAEAEPALAARRVGSPSRSPSPARPNNALRGEPGPGAAAATALRYLSRSRAFR